MLEQINDSTYRYRLAEDDVEVGDINAPTFKPHIKLNRFDGECWLKVMPVGIGEEEVEVEVEGDKVKTKFKFKYDGFEFEAEAEIYALEPHTVAAKDRHGNDIEFLQNELGGLEFNVILDRKPPTNKFVFDIETEGLRFCYQPALTAGEIAEGVVRPDNVVGSYAVYHATRTPMHRSQQDADKYKVGKAFQIYCPELIDADGVRAKGALNIDVPAGKLTVTAPQEFLDTAKYPIRHVAGATFGYTTIGSSEWEIANYLYTYPFTGAAGTVTHITFYNRQLGVGVDKCWILYDGSNRIDYSAETDIEWTPADWQTLAAQVGAVISAQTYYLGFFSEAIAAWDVYYDSDEANHNQYQSVAYTYPPPATWTKSQSSYHRKFSIYCTYTPAGGIEHEKSLSDTVTISDSISKAFGQAQADSVALADAMSNATGLVKADSMAIADSISKAPSLIKADAMAISDAISKAVGLAKADSMSIADSIVKAVGLIKADSVAIADTIVKAVGLVKAETVAIADTFTKVTSFARAISDTVGITDSISVVRGFFRSFADTVTISDSISKGVGKVRADSVSVADSIGKVISIVKSDAVTIVDSINVQRVINIILSDVVTITDSIAGVLSRRLRQGICRMDTMRVGICRMATNRMAVARMGFERIIRRLP